MSWTKKSTLILTITICIFGCKQDADIPKPSKTQNKETNSKELNPILTDNHALLEDLDTYKSDYDIIKELSQRLALESQKLPEGKRNLLINFGPVVSSLKHPCKDILKMGWFTYSNIYGVRCTDGKGNREIRIGMTALSGNRELIAVTIDYSDPVKAERTKNSFFERTIPITRIHCFTDTLNTWGCASFSSSLCR